MRFTKVFFLYDYANMLENIRELSNLNFDFEYKKRFIHAYLNENNYFQFNTPLIKVLKPIHVSLNKKRNIERKYIILEINENYNVNQELDDMALMVNKIHEVSQETIRNNSIQWFNTEFDDIGLDMKVKRPVDSQKDKKFIKILIHNNDELISKVEKLSKDMYISCVLEYKGLKVNSDHLMEEYELTDFLNEEEFNQINTDFEEDDINSEEVLLDIIEHDQELNDEPVHELNEEPVHELNDEPVQELNDEPVHELNDEDIRIDEVVNKNNLKSIENKKSKKKVEEYSKLDSIENNKKNISKMLEMNKKNKNKNKLKTGLHVAKRKPKVLQFRE